MNGFRDISGHIKRNFISHALREVKAEFFHFVLDTLGYFHGIGTR